MLRVRVQAERLHLVLLERHPWVVRRMIMNDGTVAARTCHFDESLDCATARQHVSTEVTEVAYYRPREDTGGVEGRSAHPISVLESTKTEVDESSISSDVMSHQYRRVSHQCHHTYCLWLGMIALSHRQYVGAGVCNDVIGIVHVSMNQNARYTVQPPREDADGVFRPLPIRDESY